MSMTATSPRPLRREAQEQIREQLPEHRQKAVEAGLAMYQNVVAERDDLDRRLREANMELEGMRVQLTSLKSVVNMMESSYASIKIEAEERVRLHQDERDRAVGKTAALEAILMNVHVILGNSLDTYDREHGEQS